MSAAFPSRPNGLGAQGIPMDEDGERYLTLKQGIRIGSHLYVEKYNGSGGEYSRAPCSSSC